MPCLDYTFIASRFSFKSRYIEFATPEVNLSERVEEFLPISITVRLSGFAPETSLNART
jgi:hypothetical protein